MPDPIQWRLRRYGPDEAKIDYTFEEFGITGATQRLVNQGEDTCDVQFSGLRPAALGLIGEGEWVTIFGGALAWFSGRMVAPARSAVERSQTSSLTLHGPWYDLAQSVYMAPGAYVTNPPQVDATGVVSPLPFAPVKGSAISSNLLLGKDQDGTLIDGMQTLRRALAYAQKAGAWFALGTLPDSLPIPAEAIRDKTVADIIRACVRWNPSLVVFFDYGQLPPALHIVPRAALAPVSFACGDGGTAESVSVRARPDQVIPGVCVQYVRQFTQTPQIQIDTTGGTQAVKVAPVKAQPVTDLTGTFVPATGPGINVGNSHFVPATGPGLDFGTGVSFVPGPSPFFRPNAPTVYAANGDLIQSSGGVTTVTPPASGSPTPPAPTTPASSLSQAPAFSFYSIEYEVAGQPFLATGEIVLKLGALAFTVELNGGELNAVGYSPADLDPPPYGLAAMIFEGRSVPPWEGSISLKARDVGFANYIGRAVNVTGGDPEWTGMNALCQALTRDTSRGETTLTLGSPTPLGASDVQALLRAARGFVAVKGTVALTDPTLPPTHDPLPPPRNPSPPHHDTEDDPDDHALSGFLSGPGYVRGSRRDDLASGPFGQHDGIDHGPVGLGAPWFNPVIDADAPGLYCNINLTAGYAFDDHGNSSQYHGHQTSDSRRSGCTLDLRSINDYDGIIRTELIGTNISSGADGEPHTQRVSVDVSNYNGQRIEGFVCPDPPHAGEEDKIDDPPAFPYRTQKYASVVFNKLRIIDRGRVYAPPPTDYPNPPEAYDRGLA